MVSQQALADRLGISRSAVAGHIMHLTNKGLIKGRGYVVADTPFVAVIGGTNMDIHGKSSQRLRAHDSNPGAVRTSPGGVGRNVAENLARLGVECRLLSAVGNDDHGRALLRLGREAGIDMQHVLMIDAAPTSTYLSVLDDDGDMRVAISDMSVIKHVDAARLQSQKSMLGQSSLIVIDTNLPADSLAWLADTFAGHTIFADTVSSAKAPRLKSHLHAIHTLKTSTIEVEALTGLPAGTRDELAAVAEHLHAAGVQRVFVTLGEPGAFVSTGSSQGTYKLRHQGVDVVNAGGAGDAFLAGLVYAWLEGWPLQNSVQFALAAARVTLADAATSSSALSLNRIRQVIGG